MTVHDHQTADFVTRYAAFGAPNGLLIVVGLTFLDVPTVGLAISTTTDSQFLVWLFMGGSMVKGVVLGFDLAKAAKRSVPLQCKILSQIFSRTQHRRLGL
jgi:hypothetical protein